MSDKSPFSSFPANGPRGASSSHWGAGDFDDDYARWRAEYDRDMQRRRRRPRPPVGPILLCIGLLFATAFFAAPLFAFRALRSAAQFGDIEALNQTADFDSVRQSLRVQLRPASSEAGAPVSALRDPLAALRRAWEPLGPQQDVNAYLSAESLAALTSGRGPEGPTSTADGPMAGPLPRIRYWGFDRTRLGVRDPVRTERETVFTFERRGLFRWTLVGVKLPALTPMPAD